MATYRIRLVGLLVHAVVNLHREDHHGDETCGMTGGATFAAAGWSSSGRGSGS